MIILLDVDGVLVENRAYWAGIQRTTEYFSRRLGLARSSASASRADLAQAQQIRG